MRRVFGILIFLITAPAHAANVLLDDFNRADSPTLGGNWIGSSCAIASGRANCSADDASEIYGGVTSNSISADVFHTGTGLDYGALVLGYNDISSQLYIKLQSTGGANGFDRIGFYFGEQGMSNNAWSDSGFGDIGETFSAARFSITLTGTNLLVEIDTDFDNLTDIQFLRTDVPVHLLGDGIGIAGWTGQGATLDNFSANIVPIPAAMWLMSSALGLLGWFRRIRV
ncbi:MAG: hypothetical protein ACR2P6_06060 [Gammaproteobacteria bacterium]